MKICKDCQHAKRHWLFGWDFAKCRAPQLLKAHPVTGVTEADPSYCVNQRKFDYEPLMCGPNAKFFEPKG